jgi:hypothetical protein
VLAKQAQCAAASRSRKEFVPSGTKLCQVSFHNPNKIHLCLKNDVAIVLDSGKKLELKELQ